MVRHLRNANNLLTWNEESAVGNIISYMIADKVAISEVDHCSISADEIRVGFPPKIGARKWQIWSSEYTSCNKGWSYNIYKALAAATYRSYLQSLDWNIIGSQWKSKFPVICFVWWRVSKLPLWKSVTSYMKSNTNWNIVDIRKLKNNLSRYDYYLCQYGRR